jgi:hypothetical protein
MSSSRMTATLESVWQALAADAPAEAARARPVLDDVLRTTHASPWPEVAWCSSTLTPDGAPVEFVWRPGVRGVFWTAEVAGPETPDELRFPLAIDRLGAWGPAPRRQLPQLSLDCSTGAPCVSAPGSAAVTWMQAIPTRSTRKFRRMPIGYARSGAGLGMRGRLRGVAKRSLCAA